MVRVSLVAAAVCPHPPLIVPEVAAGAAPELDELRSACDEVLDELWRAQLDEVVLLGSGERTEWFKSDVGGSLQGFGVRLDVPPPTGDPLGETHLPLSLTIGAWLLARRPPGTPVVAATIARDAPVGACAAFGADLPPRAHRVGLLVMGDGSARRSTRAPGYEDPRAEPYDTTVSQALARADVEALLGLDEALSAELWVAGRAPWQALAGAVRDAGGAWTGDLRYDAAPYGVGYFVALWRPA
ncbi:MAG TPA: class III extradiol dioxygenase subunit B-like domain-containing protein [Micromonosporaceae bacterium]